MRSWHWPQDAFRSLLGSIGEVGIEAEASPAVAEFALIPWALVHGLAAVAGQLPCVDSQRIEALAKRTIDVLYEGMATTFLSRRRAGVGSPGTRPNQAASEPTMRVRASEDLRCTT